MERINTSGWTIRDRRTITIPVLQTAGITDDGARRKPQPPEADGIYTDLADGARSIHESCNQSVQSSGEHAGGDQLGRLPRHGERSSGKWEGMDSVKSVDPGCRPARHHAEESAEQHAYIEVTYYCRRDGA